MATTLDILEYELHDNLIALKDATTWIYICAFLALFCVIIDKLNVAIFFIVVILIIEMFKDYKSGRVDAYIRKKKGIPSAGDIRRMKEKHQQSEESE